MNGGVFTTESSTMTTTAGDVDGVNQEVSGELARLRGVVDGLAGEKALAVGHLLPSVRGELLSRLGRDEEARAAFSQAAERAQNERERAILLARAATR